MPSEEIHPEVAEPGRVLSRRLVSLLMGLGFIGTLSGFVGAALAYLWPVRGEESGSNLLLGSEGPLAPEAIPAGQGAVGRSRAGKVLVVHRGDEWIGLRATCTHLGCTVAWNEAAQQVECPCHGARFSLAGQVLRGPAQEPLLQVRLAVDARGIRVISSGKG